MCYLLWAREEDLSEELNWEALTMFFVPPFVCVEGCEYLDRDLQN